MKARLALITIGQAPRVGVVPEMVGILGPGVELVERGALDEFSPAQIGALARGPGDDVLVTRLTDGSSVFVAKRRIMALVQRRIEEADALGVGMTVLMSTRAAKARRTECARYASARCKPECL